MNIIIMFRFRIKVKFKKTQIHFKVRWLKVREIVSVRKRVRFKAKSKLRKRYNQDASWHQEDDGQVKHLNKVED